MADTSIYNRVGQGGDVGTTAMNALSTLLRGQAAAQQNRLADLQFQTAERDVAKADAVNKAFAAPGAMRPDGSIDASVVTNTLAQLGQGGQIPTVLKSQADLTASSNAAKKTTFDLNEAKSKRLIQTFATAQTPQELADLAQQGVAAGDWTAAEAAPYIQRAPQDAAQFRQYTTGILKRILTPEQQLQANTQKIDLRDTGGAIVAVNTNPLAGPIGPVQGMQPLAKTVSPDSVLSAETSRANNAASVGASLANAAATRDVAQSNRDSARIQTQFGNEQGLRKEFDALPEVKNYKQALPAFQAVKDAAGRNTTQADINLVYGIAKLYDPNSVVREGEYATVANSPNIPERIKGYAQYLQGGGRLTPKVKEEIMAEATGRLQSYQGEVVKARDSFANIAQQAGIPPARVLQGVGDFEQGATAPSTQPARSAPKAQAAQVPAQAADYLRANPSLRAQFDAKYGAGASASVLGR